MQYNVGMLFAYIYRIGAWRSVKKDPNTSEISVLMAMTILFSLGLKVSRAMQERGVPNRL